MADLSFCSPVFYLNNNLIKYMLTKNTNISDHEQKCAKIIDGINRVTLFLLEQIIGCKQGL